ncbi:MAG: MmcQ/YjbR family DNA-binding protein [Candidatus Promineifilaceae bacterium]
MSKDNLERVREICFDLPETEERLSHGEPTFFVRKKVFVMYANNHHDDGRIAVWLPAQPGMQEMLVDSKPGTFFRPPYVGHRGWIGVILDKISDEDLTFYIREGWRLIAPKKLQAAFDENG